MFQQKVSRKTNAKKMLRLQSKLIYLINASILLFHSQIINAQNFIVILTDDQDQQINGLEPIKNALNYVFGNTNSIQFINSYTVSPLCCPSRAAILTGRYPHNHGTKNNTRNGNCNGEDFIKNSEPKNFLKILKDQRSYTTFYSGKYLNQYWEAERIPPGIDHWYGLLGNSRYYGYQMSHNGVKKSYDHDYKKDYLPNVIKNQLFDFLEEYTFKKNDKRFIAVASLPSCHSPWNSEPKYSDRFKNMGPPDFLPNYNFPNNQKHWLVRQAPVPMSNASVEYLTNAFKSRWRTLLTVGDLLKETLDKIKQLGISKDTYIIFTSDNGYHLGSFGMPLDKRQNFETDLRVPLFFRRPDDLQKQSLMKTNKFQNFEQSSLSSWNIQKTVVSNIDLAPTILDLANVPETAMKSIDGRSYSHLIHNQKVQNNFFTEEKRRIFIEYYGEAVKGKPSPENCPGKNLVGLAQCFPDCVCDDSWNNTYTRVSHFSKNPKKRF